MKLKIISDGSVLGTRVVNADTGEPVEKVVSVQWEHSAPGAVPIATIELLCPMVDVIGEDDLTKAEADSWTDTLRSGTIE